MELLLHIAPFWYQGKINELDQLTMQYGHQVLRLPPYHLQYNPVELTRTKAKEEVVEINNIYISAHRC